MAFTSTPQPKKTSVDVTHTEDFILVVTTTGTLEAVPLMDVEGIRAQGLLAQVQVHTHHPPGVRHLILQETPHLAPLWEKSM